ncbi:MAG: hypothetical protein ACPG7F_00575 [Aggregatilineales bacterium]
MTHLDTLNAERARLVRERFAAMWKGCNTPEVKSLTAKIVAITKQIDAINQSGGAA